MENTIRTFRLNEFRTRTFRSSETLKLSSPEQAIDFVNERGFIFFWPVKGIIFPSLWSAVAGDRPVADNHEDPGHISWEWKDSVLDKKVCIIRPHPAWKEYHCLQDTIPFFYALSPNNVTLRRILKSNIFRDTSLWKPNKFLNYIAQRSLDTISYRKTAHNG
jgi:hypothetical protein